MCWASVSNVTFATCWISTKLFLQPGNRKCKMPMVDGELNTCISSNPSQPPWCCVLPCAEEKRDWADFIPAGGAGLQYVSSLNMFPLSSERLWTLNNCMGGQSTVLHCHCCRRAKYERQKMCHWPFVWENAIICWWRDAKQWWQHYTTMQFHLILFIHYSYFLDTINILNGHFVTCFIQCTCALHSYSVILFICLQ